MVRLPTAESVPSRATLRRDLLDLAGEEVELAGRWRLADVAQSDAAAGGEPCELGVLGQEVVQTGVDVEAEVDGAPDVGPGGGVEPAAVGREPDDQMGRRVSCPAAAAIAAFDVGLDRDAGRAAVEDLTGVPAGVSRVDHREHAVAPRPADQTVSGLAVGGAEGTLAVDDGVAFDVAWSAHASSR